MSVQGWQHVSMFPTASRAKPGGGSWLSALIPVPGAHVACNGRPEGLQLEFYVAGEDGQVRRVVAWLLWLDQLLLRPGGELLPLTAGTLQGNLVCERRPVWQRFS